MKVRTSIFFLLFIIFIMTACTAREEPPQDLSMSFDGSLNELEHVKQIWKDLRPKYNEASRINTGGALKETEELIEDDGSQYFIAEDDDTYKSVSDIYEAIENVFTKEYADKSNLYPYTLYKEIDGKLCVLHADGPSYIFFDESTLKIKSYEIVLQMDIHEPFGAPTAYMTLKYMDGKWLIDNIEDDTGRNLL